MTNDPAPHRDDIDAPGLERLQPTDRRRVTELGRRVHVPQHWTMVREDQPADEAWLVLEGMLRVESRGQVLADIGPGGFVGEMGLVDHLLRNARVTTLEDVEALAFPKSDFQRLRQDIPDFDALVRESTRWRHEDRVQPDQR
jgi:CRP/FNR family cyclic AMP-dependent transcriptional regulator